jgi:hypothetical protein
MDAWISVAASLVAALIGGGIAITGVSRTLHSQVRLQDRAYLATIARELAGRLVAAEIALDSYTITRSDLDRRDLISALDDLLPQTRVVGLTVPAGQLKDKFEAVSSACLIYRKRLLQPQSQGEASAESATRAAMKEAMDSIETRYSNVKDPG